MSRFTDAIRRGRDEAVARRRGRAVRPEYPGEPRDDGNLPSDEDDYRPYDDPPPAGSGHARIAELESALQRREAEYGELQQLAAELAAELEKALLAIDLFPRSALLLRVFEGFGMADAATLLDANPALIRKAQAIGLCELTTNLAGKNSHEDPCGNKSVS